MAFFSSIGTAEGLPFRSLSAEPMSQLEEQLSSKLHFQTIGNDDDDLEDLPVAQVEGQSDGRSLNPFKFSEQCTSPLNEHEASKLFTSSTYDASLTVTFWKSVGPASWQTHSDFTCRRTFDDHSGEPMAKRRHSSSSPTFKINFSSLMPYSESLGRASASSASIMDESDDYSSSMAGPTPAVLSPFEDYFPEAEESGRLF